VPKTPRNSEFALPCIAISNWQYMAMQTPRWQCNALPV
jgi:hypothetical protein